MASGDNVDVIEVAETSFGGPTRSSDVPSRNEDSGDEDDKSTGEKVTAFDTSATQHGSGGPKTPVGVSRNKSERERKLGHRRVGVGGEITYKKIQTTQIMGSIQLGIQHAVGGLASKPERDLLMQDFMTVETTNFPSEGSNHTPAHHFSEFKFKNYAPIAFRYFRDLFGIQPDDFLMSMCSSPLRELSNPGASGSIFYLTNDDEFIIKTVQHKEGEFLQTLLPGYYMNLNQNPRTLLPKFFGLYCYRCNSKNVRLVAMNNLLPSAVKLHEKYDLKGSTYKRKASKAERSKSSPTYKDLDFMEFHPEGIFLEADVYVRMVRTMQTDCRVLESFKIMDYSLLVGIHNLDQAAREKSEQRLSASAEDPEPGEPGYEGTGFVHVERDREQEDRVGAAALNRSRSINRQRLVAHSTAMESIQAESEPIDVEGDVRDRGGIPARNARGERLLLFLGIIDILQSYRLKKKLEHTWKSMIHDGDTVSVHRPGFYAQRFQDFMTKTVFKKIPSPLKHSPSKRKSISRPLRPLEGDFDSTAVTATGSTAMHATSPTKLASPTGVETVVSSSGNVVSNSTSSVPIATSTPVNLPTPGAGGVIVSLPPPPLSASALVADGVRGSYPAVLKGRSGASPPNPNLVPSGKVPPPVPPRGSGAASGRSRPDEQRGTASSSSSTSGRGDDASNAYKLHESPRTVAPLANDKYRASGEPPRKVRTPLHENFSQRPVRPEQRIETIDENPRRGMHYNLFNFRGSTSNHGVAGKATVVTDSFLPIPRLLQHYQQTKPPQQPVYSDVRYRYEHEADEFVSVERYEDSYTIRTSTSPFRPERGRYRFAKSTDNESPAVPDPPIRPDDHYQKIKAKERASAERYAETMNKFTYFINPGGGSYKMSRKDKKHSETYAERMRREQAEGSLQSSSARMKMGVIRKNPEIFIEPASLVTPAMRVNRATNDGGRRDPKAELIPNSKQINKRVAPSPSIPKQIFADASKPSLSNSFKLEKRLSIRRVEQKIDYLRHAERDRIIANINDCEIVERKEIVVGSYRTVQPASSDSSLLSRRKKTSTRSLASRETTHERKCSVRRTTSVKTSTPNIRMDDKRKPETLKTYMSDNEYKDYLVETSSREDIRGAPQNFSFLHGYASTRSCK